jgi:hypothetical protein
MESIDEKVIGKFKIEILIDEDPLDPRKDFDPLGSMVCFHRRYNLGDKHNFDSPAEAQKFLKNKRRIAIVLPLYLYDHSGITMSTNAFSCPWDSGQVGWIYITREKIRKEYSYKRISSKLLERVKGYLIDEVKTYDQYLTGDVYGYRITEINPNDPDEEGEELDSSWGYYGDDYCMSEAESVVKHIIGADAQGQLELKMK